MAAKHTRSSYPTSPLQQGILSHHAGARPGGDDVVQISVSVREPIDPAAMREAWSLAAKRHEIFRTSFHVDPDGARQEVADAIDLPFEWSDWSQRSPEEIEPAWLSLLDAERDRGFELEKAPLWRVTGFTTGESRHRLTITFHHLLLDARSIQVLFSEVFEAHAAIVAGREPQLPPAVPYRNYIEWLRTTGTADAGFWRSQLAGFRSPTPLPAARTIRDESGPRPAGRIEATVELSPGRTAALREFARREGVTLNTLVQGAWALLLSRCTGEDDILFGAVRACRHADIPGAGRIVGLMINTVPLRITVPPDAAVGDWLRMLRHRWTEFRPHEHTALTEIRGWSDIPSSAPLFETLVSFQEPSWDAALRSQGGAWIHREFSVRNQTTQPLALDAYAGEGLRFTLSADPARYTTPAVGRLLDSLSHLLRGLAGDAGQPLSEVPILSPAERKRILEDWNLTHAEYEDDVCVHHLVEEAGASAPDSLAVSDGRRRVTYAELDREATLLARRLLACGVARGATVGVCLESSVELAIAFLAVWKTGAAYVPLDPDYPADRIRFLIRDADLRVIVTRGSAAERIPTDAATLVHVDGTGAADAPSFPVVPEFPSPDDIAYLIYTSGSTGQPKGVPIRHRSVANLIAWHQRTYGVTPADRATQIASPAFDACVWELWPYLAGGASVHIPPAEARLSPAKLAGWLCAEEITLAFVPTPLAEAMLDETWPGRVALRAILTGGDRLRRRPGRDFPCALVNHYGPTECTVLATASTVPVDGTPGPAAPGIGSPIANTQVYVLDRRRQPVPVGVPGELYLGGIGLSPGYHDRPDLTAEKFVPNPFSRMPGARLYRTGDQVRWREDGTLEYLGRLDQQVKVRGLRIEPGEIEAVLGNHDGVRECLVAARTDSSGDAALIAYYIPSPDTAPAAPDALAAFLRRTLPAWLVPSAFVPVDAWPLTAHGKIDRSRLPGPDSIPAGPAAPPRPGLEEEIAHVWSEVLGRNGFGASDDFFRLGGHSLRAAQVVARLNARMNIGLSVRHLFENSTIAGLAAVIERIAPECAAAAAAQSQFAASC